MSVNGTLGNNTATATNKTRRTLYQVTQNISFDIAKCLFAVFGKDVGNDSVFAKLKIFISINRCNAARYRDLLRNTGLTCSHEADKEHRLGEIELACMRRVVCGHEISSS